MQKPHYYSKRSLFMEQAPSWNFELGADQLLAKALELGFVKKVGEDRYLMNKHYIKSAYPSFQYFLSEEKERAGMYLVETYTCKNCHNHLPQEVRCMNCGAVYKERKKDHIKACPNCGNSDMHNTIYLSHHEDNCDGWESDGRFYF